MKQLAKGLAGLAGYAVGIMGMIATSKSEYLNTAEKIFTLGIGAGIATFGLVKGLEAMAEKDIANKMRKQKTQMSLDEAYAQIDKKYNERLEIFLKATAHPTEKEQDDRFRMKKYIEVSNERQEEKTGVFHYQHCEKSPKLKIDTSSSRQSYENKLNVFYDTYCKAA